MNKYEIKGKTYLATDKDSKVMEIAKKHGIEMPSDDLAIFITKYAALEEANLNGVRLSTEAVQKFIKSINGKLADIDHIRPYVIGSILEGWINEESKEIEIAFTMYKSVFIDEYALALEKLNSGDLAVSFELTTNPDTIEALEDNTIRLHDINFSGVGLLLNTNPAYPKAKVYEMASRLLNKVKETNMVFASQIAEELGSNVISEVENISNSEKKEDKVMELNDEQKAKIEAIKAQLGDKVKDFSNEDFFNETKLAEAGYIAETKKEEVKDAEVTVVAESKVLRDEKIITLTTYKDDGTSETKTQRQCTYTWLNSDGSSSSETTTEDITVVNSYSEAQMAEVRAEHENLKTEYDIAINRIKELENAETARLDAIEKFKADEKLQVIKDSLKDNPYVKDFSDEDYLNAEKVEKAKLQKENDDLKAKLASTSSVEVTAAEATPLVTGHQENIASESTDVRGLINKLGKD